ncbi:MAG TPA: hypothetical protein VHC20_01935 [Candidatus Paceibacterota bacterium]|nr:hypothetical protein [Candidatus Paceibacterota bacterium]
MAEIEYYLEYDQPLGKTVHRRSSAGDLVEHNLGSVMRTLTFYAKDHRAAKACVVAFVDRKYKVLKNGHLQTIRPRALLCRTDNSGVDIPWDELRALRDKKTTAHINTKRRPRR